MKQNLNQPTCKLNLLRLFVLIYAILVSTVSFGQAGNAPMQSLPYFTGPMAIDGFVTRQAANGDWNAGSGGATNVVFTNNCTALVPLAYRLTDLFNDLNDDVFDAANKLYQDPNVWDWTIQKPNVIADINNSLVYIALNPVDNHIWFAVTGDRLSTNGTTYLDFEFYQNTISKVGGPSFGGFVSTGPHGGRTVGDISITLQYTGGGSFATVAYQKWQPGAETGSYDYFDVIPAPGTAFAAANSNAIDVPCGAFGITTYQPLQFVEGAIDLTALMGGIGIPGECGSLPFKTLFIKSKSSTENTADLLDFIAPFQINVCFDQTAPIISCPQTLNLGCNATIPGPTGATASDNCNGTIIPVSSDGPVQSNGCLRTMIRTWRAQDACGNTASCGQTINWTQDNTAPSLTTGGGSLTPGCNPSAGDINVALGSASASDACGAPTLSESDGGVSSNGCARSQTRTWTASDACGNTSTASRTATWTADITPPTFIAGGGSLTLACNPSAGDINGVLGAASATDACGDPTVSSSDGSVQSDGCSRSQTRTWTARDACGNTATASRTVNWTADVTPPLITTGGTTLTPGCNPLSSDINNALGSATATDACGIPTISSSDGNVSSDGCSRSQKRIWTARDFCGNTSTAARTVTWTADVTPPVITTGGTTTTLGCNPSAGEINNALGTATATDACGIPTLSSSDGSVGSNGCIRSQTRTFTARDFCGNTSTAARTVTWTADVTPPVITTGGGSLTLGCNPSAGDINTSLGTATATDACGIPTLSSSDGSVGSNGCSRSQTRIFTATDFCGNTATAFRTATWTFDVTPPTIICSSDQSVPCGTTVVFGTPTASDNCGGTPSTIDLGNGTLVNNSDGSVTYSHSWRASDVCGNTATCSQRITVQPCGGEGCAVEFWKKHSKLWDGVAPDLPGIPFTTGSNFLSYFGITNNCDLPASAVTMKKVLNINGSGCRSLARQAIAAALNESILDTYDYPGGITQLKLDVRAAFNGGCNCAALNITLSALNDRGGTTCNALSTQRVTFDSPVMEQVTLAKDLNVTAYPNPYKDNLKFEIRSSVSGQASLEVYNSLGQKLQTVYKGYIFAGKVETVEYKVPVTNRTNLIYIFRVGDKQVTGKLLNLN